MTRYDPDGKEKRRAKKGELSCDSCYWCKSSRTEPKLYCEEVDCTGTRCRFLKDGRCHPKCRGCACDPSDYAGDCTHFVRRERG